MNLTLRNHRGSSRIVVAALAIMISLTSSMIPRRAVDFSGQWKLNESKSELGQFGARMAAATLKVTADANGMTTERKVNGQNGEMVMTEKLTFDGKETESKVFGENIRKSTAKWSEDGKVLTVSSTTNFNFNGQATEIKATETWKLTETGSLLIENSTTFGGQARTTKLAYDKVP